MTLCVLVPGSTDGVYPTHVSELGSTREGGALNTYCSRSDVISGPVDPEPFCGCTSTVFEDVTVSHQVLHNWKINDVLFSIMSPSSICLLTIQNSRLCYGRL